jgi:hypothetical protein
VTAATPLALEVQDVRHSAESACWYTPPSIVEPAREVLGGAIDLDPATDDAANRIIKARTFCFELDDGLQQPWRGSVFLNPPTPPRAWWERLMWSSTRDCVVPRAVYVAYSIEQIQQSQLWAEETGLPSMLDFAVCIPRRRIPYLRTVRDAIVAWHKVAAKLQAKGKNPTRGQLVELAALEGRDPLDLVPGDQPAHASAIVGVHIPRAAFAAAFGSLGWCS